MFTAQVTRLWGIVRREAYELRRTLLEQKIETTQQCGMPQFTTSDHKSGTRFIRFVPGK